MRRSGLCVRHQHSAGQPAADPAGERRARRTASIPRARGCKALFDGRSSSPSSRTWARWCSRRRKIGLETAARRARPTCSRTPTRSSRSRARDATGVLARGMGRPHRRSARRVQPRLRVPAADLDQRPARVLPRTGTSLPLTVPETAFLVQLVRTPANGNVDALREAAMRVILAQQPRATSTRRSRSSTPRKDWRPSSVVNPIAAEPERPSVTPAFAELSNDVGRPAAQRSPS